MNDFIFGIPALVFLVASGLVLGIFWIWNNRLSSKARALAKRINEFTHETSEFVEAIPKKERNHESEVFEGWLKGFHFYSLFEGLIKRAGFEKSPAELILYSFLIFIFSLFLFLVLGFQWMFAFIASFFMSFGPTLFLLYRENKRALKFEAQLPDALDFISRALKAGHGISAAISMVGEDLADPAGNEFKITSDQINLGLSFSDALSNLADRIKSNDLNFLVISLLIQRETGGNLSELLELISKTIRERLKLKGKVRILASEGKISGWVLTLMPFFLASILYIIKPDYIAHLWNTEQGVHMLMLASLMIPLGVFWMWKIVRIKV